MDDNGLFGIFRLFFDRSPYETKGIFKEHQIAVRLSLDEIKLYIDGQGVDAVGRATVLNPRRDVALVRGSIKEGEHNYIIEVFGKFTFSGVIG
jgi:hypothetical protein